MASLKNGPKNWLNVIPLILTLLLLGLLSLWVISIGKVPFIGAGNFVPHYSFQKYYIKLPNHNPDNTYTHTFNTSKLERVEQQKFLFNNYTVLYLRPIYRKGQISRLGEETYSIALPNNLASSVPYNNGPFYPPQLESLVGKSLSLQISTNKINATYSVYDVVGWTLIYVD